MSKVLANPTVVVNNNPIAIVPNSFSYTEGFGEQQLRVQSAGGNSLEYAASDDVTTKKAMFKFEMLNTSENIENARQWKQNLNQNVVSVSEDSFSRTFTQAMIVNDYEVSLSSDGNISLEFNSARAV